MQLLHVRGEACGELLHQSDRLKALGLGAGPDIGGGALLLRGCFCAALELSGQQVGQVGL
jgi:hypothetical protein